MNKFDIIKKYIDEFDYYSLLKIGAPNDEFDRYSKEFCNTIFKEDSVKDIAFVIAARLDTAFGNEVKAEKFLNTAEKIIDELIRYNF